ncbi:MAG TPA: ABC transporter permease [bacterium]|jgi:putative ABC transport system permease protein|nr:ABC transporter permease [bacterium]
MKGGQLNALWLLARRSLRQHRLSTALTAACVALSVGLVMAVFSIQAQSRDAFTGGAIGFDAVLGARGSQLQLVLNSIFHLETSPGNIPYRYYKAIQANPAVALAVPYAVGDNYRGYRLVGTESTIFTDFEYQVGKKLKTASGRFFDPQAKEAVVGSYVARKLGMKVGDTFHPYHGLIYDPSAMHAEVFTVVGVLEPTGTPNDRVIWIPLDSFYRIAGHVLRGAGSVYTPRDGVVIPDQDKEVSSVMIKFRDPETAMVLSQMINNQGSVATLAWPIPKVMAELFDKIGWAYRVLALIGFAVMLVSAMATVAALVNSLESRRRDFAILRALGAGRATVAGLMVLESAATGALGSLFGFAVYAAILAAAAAILRDSTGVLLGAWYWHPVLAAAPLGMTLLCGLAGLIPALQAYRVDVAAGLAPRT